MERTSDRLPPTHVERPIHTWNGFGVLALGLAIYALATWRLVAMVTQGRPTLGGIVLIVVLIIARHARARRVCTRCSRTRRRSCSSSAPTAARAASPGLRATIPFYSRRKLSARARNLNGDRLKVNDKRGNPIEIAAVVVWHVEDTAKAAFDVDDYENFVKVQSEAAVRHLASSFAYDEDDTHGGTREPTLLGSADVVANALERELQARLTQAGVVVEEARLTHLAYAPEIAQVMLRRQQAEAIIAARQKIVHGAVSMVEMALAELSAKQVVNLDDERKASMVSNLMTVLCAESEVQPVINTGTLYG